MNRKGISNLISAVLILAVSISAVSLFAQWAPSLVGEVTRGVGDQTSSQVDCNAASLEIAGAEYFSSDDNVTVVARNDGTVDLNNVSLEAWSNGLPVNNSEVSIDAGEYGRTNLTASSEPESVKAVSRECSNARAESSEIG